VRRERRVEQARADHQVETNVEILFGFTGEERVVVGDTSGLSESMSKGLQAPVVA
jgi:hypothetical protein